MPGLQDALNNFDPRAYLNINAKIRELEGLVQDQLVDYLMDQFGFNLDIPGLNVELVPRDIPKEVRITYVVKTVLHEFPEGADADTRLLVKGEAGGDIKLVLVITLTIPLTGAEPDYLANGKLKDFGVQIPHIVVLEFSSFSFKGAKGKGLDVKPQLSGVKFLDALEFLNDLSTLLADKGNGGFPGLSIHPSPTGLDIGLALSIPPLAVGIFSLRNVKFSFGLTIPFDGQKISFRYAVSERHDPFIVAVGIFGGGGFFGIRTVFHRRD